MKDRSKAEKVGREKDESWTALPWTALPLQFCLPKSNKFYSSIKSQFLPATPGSLPWFPGQTWVLLLCSLTIPVLFTVQLLSRCFELSLSLSVCYSVHHWWLLEHRDGAWLLFPTHFFWRNSVGFDRTDWLWRNKEKLGISEMKSFKTEGLHWSHRYCFLRLHDVLKYF